MRSEDTIMLVKSSKNKEGDVKSPSYVETTIDDKRDTLEQTALPFENVYGFVKDRKKTILRKKKK